MPAAGSELEHKLTEDGKFPDGTSRALCNRLGITVATTPVTVVREQLDHESETYKPRLYATSTCRLQWCEEQMDNWKCYFVAKRTDVNPDIPDFRRCVFVDSVLKQK